MNSAKINVYYRSYVLPWDDFGDQERRFRTILQRVGIAGLVLCVLMSLLPVPERDVQLERPVPPRLARLLIDKPTPIPPPPPPVVQPEQQRQEPVAPTERATESRTMPAAERKSTAREKAGKAGLLPFVDQLAELRDSKALTSITSSGTSYTGAVGDSPQVERALITSKAGVGSGGINTAGMSRNTGGSGLGGRSTTQVSSGVAALGGGGSGGGADEGGGGDGQRASRSREEIERVFDQNKGAIYALYNRALRENPELQGKLVLKLTIEASGEVSMVEIVSSELADQELERKLVQRIRMFRFLEKDVPPVTTTKPIDFFPA